MDERDSGQPQFRGQDATECRNFIAALMKLAFAQGKQRDDQWMADFAATCMADDALAWWTAQREDVQGSWKLLSQALLSKYRPLFYGGSGEEAEKFIRAVREKAMDEGRRKDNEWIVAYAESCLAGEALRWHVCLDSDTQENWKKLQQALLLQYPRNGPHSPALNLVPTPPAAVSLAPAPKVARRGRIRVSRSNSSPFYVSKHLSRYNRVVATVSVADAMELEWNISSDGAQTLSIPGSQIPGNDLLGIKWLYSYEGQGPGENSLALCAVDSRTNSTSIEAFSGDLLTNDWVISAKDGRSDGPFTVSAKAGKEALYPRSNGNQVWFSEKTRWSNCPAEFFFEPI